jgi:hypothetical protein
MQTVPPSPESQGEKQLPETLESERRATEAELLSLWAARDLRRRDLLLANACLLGCIQRLDRIKRELLSLGGNS